MSFGEMHSPLSALQLMRGKIANTPSDDADDLFVTIPSYHHSERWGPAPFMPRVDSGGNQVLPSQGDECLVGLDEDGDSYVLIWWPS